jgi:KDO2-lipid IV(A) lauroyltransferase
MPISRKTRKKIKKVRAFFRDVLSWPAKPFFWLLFVMPSFIVETVAEISGFLFWYTGIPWRRRVLKNLEIVYGNTRTKKELKEIARESMKNIVRMMAEGAILYRPPYTHIANTKIEGEEYLKDALEKGKGVLGLGSHVGNFLLLICVLTHRGYPFTFIFKEPRAKNFRDFVWRIMDGLKLDPIPVKPRSTATKRSIGTLRKNGILWLALDQGTRHGDAAVEFFQIKTATARGPVILAQRTGCVVLPMYTKRNGWLDHTVVIKEPVPLRSTDDRDTDISHNLRTFNRVIEEEIMENPEEWWWVHDRWKRSYES